MFSLHDWQSKRKKLWKYWHTPNNVFLLAKLQPIKNRFHVNDNDHKSMYKTENVVEVSCYAVLIF